MAKDRKPAAPITAARKPKKRRKPPAGDKSNTAAPPPVGETVTAEGGDIPNDGAGSAFNFVQMVPLGDDLLRKPPDVTAQQWRFVLEYMIELTRSRPNAGAAARRAGYSAKTAYSQASRLLKHVKIARYVRDMTTAQFRSLGMERDEVLARLAAIARSDPSRGVVQVRDVLSALDKIARSLKIYDDSGQSTGGWAAMLAYLHASDPRRALAEQNHRDRGIDADYSDLGGEDE